MQVALLKTLALVALELPSVPAATLQQCMSVAERLAGAYSRLWPKQRASVDNAFIVMLQALSTKQAHPPTMHAYNCFVMPEKAGAAYKAAWMSLVREVAFVGSG